MNERRGNNRQMNRPGQLGLQNNRSPMEASESSKKRIIPLKRTVQSTHYVVGLITLEEHRNKKDPSSTDEVEFQDSLPKEIKPPYILCMNFSKVKNSEKNPDVVEITNDNKADEVFPGLDLVDKENFVLKACMEKFWDYQTQIEPCCEKTNKFWEWVFTMWPDSKFKWSFKNVDKKWLEYMISFSQFREPLRKWIVENKEEIVQDLENKTIRLLPQKIVEDILVLINEGNTKFYNYKQAGKPFPEPNHFEMKGSVKEGVLVIYDPNVVSTNCRMNISDKLACNPDKDSPLLKAFNKGLKKRRDKPVTGAPIFKYSISEPKNQTPVQVNLPNISKFSLISEAKLTESKSEQNGQVEQKPNSESGMRVEDDDNLITIHMDMEIEPNEDHPNGNKIEIEHSTI